MLGDCWHSGSEYFQLHCRPCDRDKYPKLTTDQWGIENIANSLYCKTLATYPDSPFVAFATYLTDAFYKSGEKRKLASLAISKHVGKSQNTYCIQLACSNCCRATDPLYPCHGNHAVLVNTNEIMKKIVEHLIPSSTVLPLMDMIALPPPPPPPPPKSCYQSSWGDTEKPFFDDSSTEADSCTTEYDIRPVPAPPLPKSRYRCYWEDTRKQQPVYADTSTDWHWTGQGRWHWEWAWN